MSAATEIVVQVVMEEPHWQEKAATQQRHLGDSQGGVCWSGDPDSSQRSLLKKQLANILFGAPPKPGKMNLVDFGYSSEEMKTIEALATKINRHFTGITSVSPIFITANVKGKCVAQPVFRVWDEHRCRYIDPKCRVYEDWRAFLKENRIKVRELCYPRNGTYDEPAWQVAYGISPWFSPGKRAMRALDLTLNILAIVAIITFVLLDNRSEAGQEFTFYAVLAIIDGVAITLYDWLRLSFYYFDYKRHI